VVRVLVVDDHRLFAEALSAMLGSESAVEVVGLATSGADAVSQAEELEPDVVLMDISMPGVDGFEATRRILSRRPATQVLMVTGSDAGPDIASARGAGAAGYVTKDQIAAELIDAILDAAGPRPVP
jgi:DNA-binding NarL/FixJ family response regulator